MLGNLLAGERIVRAGSGNKKGKGNIRAGFWKRIGLGTTFCLGCKDFTHNFRLQEVKMTNK